jgi:hypothetical protein
MTITIRGCLVEKRVWLKLRCRSLSSCMLNYMAGESYYVHWHDEICCGLMSLLVDSRMPDVQQCNTHVVNRLMILHT